jgi:hypothetical protein
LGGRSRRWRWSGHEHGARRLCPAGEETAVLAVKVNVHEEPVATRFRAGSIPLLVVLRGG